MQHGDEDRRLMRAFRDGDESAFDALFGRWSGRLLRYLERMVREPAVAEELMQESFLRVHRAREKWEPSARFSTWLYTIATRVALNELRRPARRSAHASVDEAGGPSLALASSGTPPDELAHAHRVGSAVEAELRQLPERQRAALWLTAVEGLSYAEVAEGLETTPQSVKALVHRARTALAARLPEAAR